MSRRDEIDEMFYRIDENGDAAILYATDGCAVTRIESDPVVYPVDSGLSTHYEHAEGIVLTVADAEKIGIESEQ